MARSEQEILNSAYDGASFRTSAVQIDGTNLRISAIQADAGNYQVSAKSNDGALFRTSAVIRRGGDPIYTSINSYQRVSAAGNTTIYTPGAAKTLRITDLIITSLSANVVSLTGAGSALRGGPMFFAANGGMAINFQTPYVQLSANETLGISAQEANSIGIVFSGYEI